jgi:hypothetical protein
MEDNKNQIKLYAKLLELRKSVSYLQKSKEGAQYKYVPSSQVLGAVQAKMNQLSLITITSVTATRLTQFQTKGGANQFMTEVDYIISWIDTETGCVYDVPWTAQGVDNGEKGIGKASTYGLKYFLIHNLGIAIDDLDPDSYQEKNASADDLKAAQEERKLKAAQEERKQELIAAIGKCVKLEAVTKIWTGNPDLKKDKEFAAAVKKKGEALKVAEEKAAKDAEPKDQPEDEQPK